LIHTVRISAASYTKTVKAGGWAEYNVKSYFFTNVTEQQLIETFGENFNNTLQYYRNINDTLWKLYVNKTDNDGEIVFTLIQRLKNGSNVLTVYNGNVFTGSGNLSLWFISPNVNVNQPLYVSNETYKLKAKGIDVEMFAGASRECVLSDFLRPEIGNAEGWYQCVWDRETGLLCTMLSGVKYPASHIDFRTNIYCNISRTNLWTLNSSTSIPYAIYVTIVFLLALLAIYIVYVKKIKKIRKKRVHSK